MKHAAAGNMENMALLFTGTIRARSEHRFMIVADGMALKAERAAGCLLEPEVGDSVLCTRTESGVLYILSVLVRAREEAAAHISAGKHLELSGQKLSVDFNQAVDLVSPQVRFQTETALVRFQNASILGGRLTGTIQAIRTMTDILEVNAGRILQRAGRVYRRIAQFEEAQIGRIRLLVDDLFHVKSKNASIKADKRVRVDGEKIELG